MIITLGSTPKNPIFGKPVVIFCEAVGVPLPSYTIIHNGTNLVSTWKTYIVSAMKFSHAGSYKCIGANILGNCSKTFNLSVLGIVYVIQKHYLFSH